MNNNEFTKTNKTNSKQPTTRNKQNIKFLVILLRCQFKQFNTYILSYIPIIPLYFKIKIIGYFRVIK